MLPITRHGLREIVIGSLILAAIAAGVGFVHWSLTLLILPLWVWLMAFFRDPQRTLPAEQHAMVSPADGKVTDILELDHEIGRASCRERVWNRIVNARD